MLNKLYIFAIGGSGERVMYSFLMELVAGMPINASEIVPVFVDNDKDSPTLESCLNLLNAYRGSGTIVDGRHECLGARTLNTRFSSQESEWGSYFHVNVAAPITLNTDGDVIGNLQSVIGALNQTDSIDREIIEERDLLFSSDDLNMPLNVGFIGNPNIGSVVLNSEALHHAQFQSILNEANNNDGVIVIGSLFGGTGAAGLPLIVHQFASKATATRPLLGAVAVLPYFSTDTAHPLPVPDHVANMEFAVNSDSFDTKTRAALMYYEKHLNQLNYLYYVGSDQKVLYPHCIGGENQYNPTHLIEVLSAMSIFDFAQQPIGGQIRYKTPVWDVDQNTNDSNILGITNKELQKAIVKFQVMVEWLSNPKFLKKDILDNQRYVHNIGFNEDMRKALVTGSHGFQYMDGLHMLLKLWDKWTKELKNEATNYKVTFFTEKDTIDEAKLFTYLCGDSTYGIAKTETRGILSRRTEIIDAKIRNALNIAYDANFPHGNSENANGINEDKRAPILMKIISDAVDACIRDYTVLQ